MTIHEAVAVALTQRGHRATHEFPGYVAIQLTDLITLAAGTANETWQIDLLVGEDHVHALDTGIDSRSEDVAEIADAILRTAFTGAK